VSERVGVLLMTYGSPASSDDVPAYLARVRNRPVAPEVAAEFTRRYRVIGGSPLVEITRRQAAALEARLGPERARVLAAMRFSDPTIEAAVRELAQLGIPRAVGVVLSPQFSPLLMGGYARAVETAREAIGPGAPDILIAPAWHTRPDFVAALGTRIRDALDHNVGGGPLNIRAVPVLLTAHSLPREVAEREPDYLEQLRVTASLVAEAAGLEPGQWQFCWQSAGHEPGDWMRPDFADLMPELAAAGHRAVVVAPVQFVADHLEILYDVDVGAREQAESAGLRFTRIRSLNDDPGLIEALAAVVDEAAAALVTTAG
jgi:ferrochelatase